MNFFHTLGMNVYWKHLAQFMLSSPRPPPFVRVRTHEWHFSVVQNLNRNIFHFHQKSTTIYNFFFSQQQECSIGMMKNSWSIARRMKSNESFQKGNKREILNLIAFLSAYGSMCVCMCIRKETKPLLKRLIYDYTHFCTKYYRMSHLGLL